MNVHLWKGSSLGEIQVHLWLETLAKKSISKVDSGINFVKTLIEKMKNWIKGREKKCFAFRIKWIKEYYHNITENNNIVKNNLFWNVIITILVNKGSLTSC